MLKVKSANIPIFFSANNVEIFTRIPVKEKSISPSMRNALQAPSRSTVFSGIPPVRQAKEFSSSVLSVKQYSASNFT